MAAVLASIKVSLSHAQRELRTDARPQSRGLHNQVALPSMQGYLAHEQTPTPL